MHAPDALDVALPLNSAVLSRVVRTALAAPSATIEHWHVQPAGPSSGAATVGVYRIAGTARVGRTVHAWTVILKLIRPARQRT